MGTIPILVLVVLMLTVAFSTAAALAVRRACRRGAAKIHRELVAMFAGEHEFRIVPLEEARAWALPEDDGTVAALRELGFRRLGWIEDMTTSAIYPRLRTIIECHASADGGISATVVRVAGLELIDLGTRFANGRFMVTTNAEINKLQPPPSTEKETLPAATPVSLIHARHLERLAVERQRGMRIHPCRGLDDVMDGSRLYSRQSSDHRRSIGYLTREELFAMSGGPKRDAVARRVWNEFEHIRDLQRRAA